MIDASIIDSSAGNDPEASFTAIVRPIVTKTIGGKTCVDAAPCHGGGQPPNMASAASLLAKYKMKPGMSNIFVTHGAHLGPALPAADAKAIADWINSL